MQPAQVRCLGVTNPVCSGESDVRRQPEEQGDTNRDHTFDRARGLENKIHSIIVVGCAYANLTTTKSWPHAGGARKSESPPYR